MFSVTKVCLICLWDARLFNAFVMWDVMKIIKDLSQDSGNNIIILDISRGGGDDEKA